MRACCGGEGGGRRGWWGYTVVFCMTKVGVAGSVDTSRQRGPLCMVTSCRTCCLSVSCRIVCMVVGSGSETGSETGMETGGASSSSSSASSAQCELSVSCPLPSSSCGSSVVLQPPASLLFWLLKSRLSARHPAFPAFPRGLGNLKAEKVCFFMDRGPRLSL